MALNPALGADLDLIPERQVAILRDGDLTFDEYEAATLAAIQCMTEEGLILANDLTYDDVANRFDYRMRMASLAGAEVLNACVDEHTGFLDVV